MKKGRALLLVLIAALFVAQGFMQVAVVYPKWSKDYSPNKGSMEVGGGLNPDQFLFALVGLREFIAGILWVRADSFFDTGNYDAILPIIRLVTWLDPKQIDVYATGMWHIGYNFTDEEQRSDRRYIPSALALGKEGAKQNPDTYEMFFEVAWMWFHKVDDNYDQAVRWFQYAHERKDILPARRSLLVNAYLRNGEIDRAVELQFKLRQLILEENKDKVTAYQRAQAANIDTIEGNIDNMLVRLVQRGWLARKRDDGTYEKGDYDTLPPFDVGFSAKVTVDEPKILKVEGTWNVLPIGTRVRCILRDADYETEVPAGLIWDKSDNVNLDPDRQRTFMMEQLFVRNQRFSRRIDMSKDPTMYPFIKKDYIIEFYYNPRSAPAHIQDKFGFNGEGMTDKNFLNTDVRKGQRVVYAKLSITRDQLLRQGEWLDRTPVVKTANYNSGNEGGQLEDVIEIPSMRSSTGGKK
jgi:hypothetical protein